MKELELKNRKGEVIGHTKVDDIDYANLKDLKWILHPTGYAVIYLKGTMYYMHKLLTGTVNSGFDTCVDHIDNDRLNNTRENLRVVNRKVNNQKRRSKYAKTGTRGITQMAENSFKVVCARKYIGSYPTIFEAAEAYDKAALEAFGPLAILNNYAVNTGENI